MKPTNVDLDEQQAHWLYYLSLLEKRPVAEIVREALREYLDRRDSEVGLWSRVREPLGKLPDPEYQARFEAILERLRAAIPPDMTPEEIEVEITAASEEMRQERLARRRAKSA